MKVTLLIFTLNEIEGMRVIMPRIKRDWYDELIIVDGDSTDGTIEYAKERGYSIFVQKERGTGAAFIEAMEKVTGDVVIVFSPDGNSLPEIIPDLIKKMKEGYDIVIASRYLNGARSYDDDIITAFGNKMFTLFVNLLFGLRITDLLVMYRAFRKNLVSDLGIRKKTVAWPTRILLRAVKKGLKIGEVPADEPPRIGGVRKLRIFKDGLCELSVILEEFFVRKVY